jgi:SAM-dependent methyltransferase
VLAVEPSATMRAQRPAGSAPCIDARAESLPLDDDSVDAAMACVTIHHWNPRDRGLQELRRVARGPVVVFTFDLRYLPGWQLEMLHEAIALEAPRFGTPANVAAVLRGRGRVETIPTPADCSDGFFEAFWNRPEALLDPAIRETQSVWQLLGEGVEERIVERLRASLASGDWDRRYGQLREMGALDGALRLVVSEAG